MKTNSEPDPRLDEIAGRLGAATPGPWEIDSIESGEHGVFAEDHHRLGCGTNQVAGFMTKANAELLVNAPTDLAYLLAELRKRDAALGRVGVIERRLERSMQGEDREIAEDLRAALGDGDE